MLTQVTKGEGYYEHAQYVYLRGRTTYKNESTTPIYVMGDK